MDEIETKETTLPVIEAPAKPRRPSDVDVFLHLLPNIAGSLAQKHEGARTVRDLSIGIAREITGQLVNLGVCERTTIALDGQYLATPGPNIASSQPAAVAGNGSGNATQSVQPALGNNNGHGIQGAMMAHFPTTEVTKIPTL
jgi:hypothetical protein